LGVWRERVHGREQEPKGSPREVTKESGGKDNKRGQCPRKKGAKQPTATTPVAEHTQKKSRAPVRAGV